MFDGNQESDNVVYNKLRRPIVTRYIRVIPAHWNNRISMRIELFGCPGISIRADLDTVKFRIKTTLKQSPVPTLRKYQ